MKRQNLPDDVGAPLAMAFLHGKALTRSENRLLNRWLRGEWTPEQRKSQAEHLRNSVLMARAMAEAMNKAILAALKEAKR